MKQKNDEDNDDTDEGKMIWKYSQCFKVSKLTGTMLTRRRRVEK